MSTPNSSALGRRPASGKHAPASGNLDDPVLFSSTMAIGNLKDKILERVNAKVIQRPTPQVKAKSASKPLEGSSGDHDNRDKQRGADVKKKDKANSQMLTYTIDRKTPLNPSLESQARTSDKKGKIQPSGASNGGNRQRRNSLTGIVNDLNIESKGQPVSKQSSRENLTSHKNHKDVLNSHRDELARLRSQPENQRANKSKPTHKQSGAAEVRPQDTGSAGSRGEGHAAHVKNPTAKARPASAKAPQQPKEAPRSKTLARPQSAKALPPKHPSFPAQSKAGQKNLKGTYLIQYSRPPRGKQTKAVPPMHCSLSSDEDEEIARACRGSGEILSDSDSGEDDTPQPSAQKKLPPHFGGGHSSLFTGAGTKFEYDPNIRKSVLDQVEDIMHPHHGSDDEVTDRTHTTEQDEMLRLRKPLPKSATDEHLHDRLSQSFTSTWKDSHDMNAYCQPRLEMDHSELSSHRNHSSHKPRSIAAVPSLALSEDAVQVVDEAVDDWLLHLDLRNADKYRKIFAKHELEKEDLKYLTKDQLQQMGVEAVGSLNKILKGIENLWLEDVKEKESPKPPSFDPFSTGVWNESGAGARMKNSNLNSTNSAKSNYDKSDTYNKVKLVSPDSESTVDQEPHASSQTKQSNSRQPVDSRTYTKHSGSMLHDAASTKPPQPKAGGSGSREKTHQVTTPCLSQRSGSGSDTGDTSDRKRGREAANPSGSRLRSASAGRKAGEEKAKSGGRSGARPNSSKAGLPRTNSYEAFARRPASEDKGLMNNEKVMEKHRQQRNKMAARHQDRERKKQEVPKDYEELCLAGEREQEAKKESSPHPNHRPPPAFSGWTTTTPDFQEKDPDLESLVAMTTHSGPLQPGRAASTRTQRTSDFLPEDNYTEDFEASADISRNTRTAGMSTQTSTNFGPRREMTATQTSTYFSRGSREDSSTQMSRDFTRNEEIGTQMSRNFMDDDRHTGTQTSTVFSKRQEESSVGTQMSRDFTQRRGRSQGATQTSAMFLESAAGTQTSLDFSQPARVTNKTDLQLLIRSLKQQGGGDRSSLELVRELQQQLLSLESELLADSDQSPVEPLSPAAAARDSSRDSNHSSDQASASPADLRPLSVAMETRRASSAAKGNLRPAKMNTVTFNLDLGDGSGQDEGSRPEGVKERQGGGRSGVASMSMSKRELLDSIRKEKDEHRKQVRHLQGELSRLQHRDPVRKSELDIRDISFNQSDQVGEGAFSQVFRGAYQGAEVAVKQLKVPLSAQDKNYFAAEVSLLRELRHPRVVLLLGVCTSERLPLMVLEYMARGNLFSLLHDPSREALDHAEYYQIARDMAAGMLYLHGHRPPILHLDLKSANVLIGSGHRAKIADFGFSKLKLNVDTKASRNKENVQGSPAWMAPEMLQGGEVTLKADVYSFGIILWEMLTRKHPYEGCSVFQILERVRQKKRPEIPESCPQELSSFIQSCWDHNPARRPVFKDILPNLEHLTFPPEWRALFQAAGVPREVLENIESTRNIISLVTSTLEASQLQEMLQQLPDAPESERSSAETPPDSQRSERKDAAATASHERSDLRQNPQGDAGNSVRSSSKGNLTQPGDLQGRSLNSAGKEDASSGASSPLASSTSSQNNKNRGRGFMSGSSLARSGTSLHSGDLKMSDVVEEDEEAEENEEEEEEKEEELEEVSEEEIAEEIEKAADDSDSFHLSDSLSGDSLEGKLTGHQSRSIPSKTASTGEPVVSGRQSQRSARSPHSQRSSREAWNVDPVSVEIAPAVPSTSIDPQNETALILTDSLTGRLDSSFDDSSHRTTNLSARQRRSTRQGGNSAPHRGRAPPPPPPPPPLPDDGAPPPPPPLLITPMSLAPTRSHAEPKASGLGGLHLDPQELQAVGRGLHKAKPGVGRGGVGGRGRGPQGRGAGGVQFSVDASALLQQRQQLKPTVHPHPNQLQDLQSVNHKTLASIAGLLKKAMVDRRFAMGETSVSMDNTVHSDLTWSFQDD